MIYIRCPRIHNLGDFSHCLPALSGLHKATGKKIHFSICNLLGRFNGLRELLNLQTMFSNVVFEKEERGENYINIHEQYDYDDDSPSPSITLRFAKSMYESGLKFEIDNSFELQVPKLKIDYLENKILVGDRWSAKDDPVKFDSRRGEYQIKNSGVLNNLETYYLDYKKSLVYNCSLIKYNPNVFITTFTGIGILADLMNKDQYIIWFDDVVGIDKPDRPIEYTYELHHFKNRKSKLIYFKNFNGIKNEIKCDLY